MFDSELLLKDYTRIIQGQYDANSAEINSPANNGLTFFDTDAMVTMAETRAWLPDEDAAKLKALFDNTIGEEELDLILVIPPAVAVMNGADEARTKLFDQHLWQVIEDYGFDDKAVLLDRVGGADDPAGYYARYLQALEIIEKRVGVNLTKV